MRLRPSPRHRLLLVVFALAPLVGACGLLTRGEPDEGTRALMETLEDVDALAGMDEYTHAQQQCALKEIQDRDVNVEAFSTGDASPRQLEDMTRILFDCVPNIREQEFYLSQQAALMELGMGGAVSISTDEVSCLFDHVWSESEDPIRTLVRTDREGDIDIMLTGWRRCLDEGDQQTLLTGGTGGYGDDPGLDTLHDACAAGNNRACDLLLISTAPDSEYAGFAESCASRATADADGLYPWCTTEVTLDASGTTTADDPGLEVLEADCVDGDFITCDLLYQISPVGSHAEHVGFTCGNRLSVGGLPNCRSRFDAAS